MLGARPDAAFWLVSTLLVVGVVMLTDLGRTAVDTKPQLYLNPDQVFAQSLSAWQALPALGQRSYESGLLVPASVASALQAVGLPAWLIMRVLRVILVLLGMAGAAWLARRVVGEGQGWAPRAAAVVYVLHPYVLVAGATLPVLWPWALLPWALGCVLLAVRSRHSWMPWTVAAALCTGAMAGQNAGSVVLLQMAVTVPVIAWWGARGSGTGWRRVLAVLAVLGSGVAALSAYWLVPGVLASGSGAAVVAQTESGESITAVSSWSEVVRGLGLWPLYGTDGTTAWVEPHVALITTPVVILAGFALLATVWWAISSAHRDRLRLAIGLIAVAALVMVGSHPWDSPSPLGRAWQAALDLVPALSVIRTTNKAGAGLVVGVALLAALAVSASGRPCRRASLIAAVAAVAVLPMWTGGLFVSTADVPRYWQDAVRATDTAGTRLWLLPGQGSASYTWSDSRPDDVVQGLYDDREVLVRTTVANSTPQGATLLAGVDRRLQEGTLPSRALAAAARYLGVGDLVVRSDVDNASIGGAEPSAVNGAVSGSEEVFAGGVFGTDSQGRDGLPPVSVYGVTEPIGPVQAMDLSTLVTVVGDASGVPDLAQLGILDGRQPFVLAADLPPGGVPDLLGRSSKVVITDTNLRAEAVPNRLTEDRGPPLSADESAERMAGIWTSDDQSVRLARGWRATASREGSAFRPLPWAAAENAVDGDPQTAWFAGDFGSAQGSVLTVEVGAARSGDLEVRTTSPGDAEITGLVLLAGEGEAALTRTTAGVFAGDLPPGTTTFSLRVSEVTPATSAANVGIAEVTIGALPSPGADVQRTPRTMTSLLESIPVQSRPAVTSRPLDVVLSRRVGSALSPVVEEPSLHRVVELPWDDSFAVRGLFGLGTPMPEETLDLAEGAAGDVRATSTSQAFGLPTGRASMALDGDDGTGWLPAEPAVGEQWRASFDKPVRASEVTVLQPTQGRQLTDIVLLVDGTPIPATLGPGSTTITLPRASVVSEVAITVTGVSEPATEPARLLEVSIGDRRIVRNAQEPGCVTVAQIDGRPVRVQPTEPLTGRAFLGGPCDLPVDLDAGAHDWVSIPEFTSDLVVWSDDASRSGSPPSPSVVDLGNGSPNPGSPPGPGWQGTLPQRSADVVVVAGVGHDPAWRLAVEGVDAGPPLLVNGYAAGWVVPAGGEAAVSLSYGPQRAAVGGLLVSVAGLLAAAGVVLTRRRAMATDLTWTPRAPRHLAGSPQPTETTRWGSRLHIVGWLALGAAVLGPPGVVAAAAGLALRGSHRRLVAPLLVAGWAVVAALWFWGARDLLGSVTPDLVTATGAAHTCAGVLVMASLVWALGPDGDEL